MKAAFARYGTPGVVVSNNGPRFASAESQCLRNPGYSEPHLDALLQQSNENAVKMVFKTSLDQMSGQS